MTERGYNFTGKSDFFDWCNMLHNPEEIISKADVFLGNAQVKLNTLEDLIPYKSCSICWLFKRPSKYKSLNRVIFRFRRKRIFGAQNLFSY